MKKLLNIILATVIVAIMLFAIGCTDNTNDPLATPAPTESPITEPIVEPQPTPTASITFEPVDNLPEKYWKAYFNVSPVGGNPRFTVYDDQGLTFYAYEIHSNTYYKGTLSLPDGYASGNIATGIRGAGSGEVSLIVLAENDELNEYIQYDLTGWYPDCGLSFDSFLYFPDSTTGGEQFVKSVNAQIEQHKAERAEKSNFPSLDQMELQIESEKVDRIPCIPEYALSDVSPIGGCPRYILCDYELVYYYYNWQYDSMYKCIIRLPDGFTDGKIVHSMRGAGSGEVEVFVLAKYNNECYYHLHLSYYGWDESPSNVSARVLNRFDDDDASFLAELSWLMGKYDEEQYNFFLELKNLTTPDRGGSYYPFKTEGDSIPDGKPLFNEANYCVASKGMTFYYTDTNSGEVSKYALPLPERFINGKIVSGEVDEEGLVHLYVLAEYLGKDYYIEYYFNNRVPSETVEVTVLNGEDPSDADKIADIEVYHYENGILSITPEKLASEYYHLGDLAEEIQKSRDKYADLCRMEIGDGVIDVIYDEYGQLHVTSVTVFGHTVTLDEPWKMHGNRITELFRADVGQPAYVFEIGTGMLNWWIFTEDGIAKELQSLPEVAEYNKIDTYLYVGDSGELLYTLTPQKYCQIHSYNDLLKYIVAVDEFAEERGYITVENCQTVYHPEKQSTIEELFGVIDMFAWWKNHISENPDIYTDKMIEAIGMFAKAETLEEYLEYNAQQYERAYSPHGELPQ